MALLFSLARVRSVNTLKMDMHRALTRVQQVDCLSVQKHCSGADDRRIQNRGFGPLKRTARRAQGHAPASPAIRNQESVLPLPQRAHVFSSVHEKLAILRDMVGQTGCPVIEQDVNGRCFMLGFLDRHLTKRNRGRSRRVGLFSLGV
jgi:hypothetical protein